MPINPNIRQTTCFVGIKDASGFKPRGTAFLAGMHELGRDWRYLITAQHNVEAAANDKRPLFARYNLQDGSVREIELPIDRWYFHPEQATEATDVAATLMGDKVDDDLLALPVGEDGIAATPDKFGPFSIGLSSDS